MNAKSSTITHDPFRIIRITNRGWECGMQFTLGRGCEKYFLTESIRNAREAFLILKGRAIDPNGLNIREETY